MKTRRILAWILSIAMILTLLPAVASADNTKTIYVGVINYLWDDTDSNNWQVRYWDGAGNDGDADCTSLEKERPWDVGYWEGNQTFKMYTANIPSDATGFKVHNGTRWFGGNGNASENNCAFVFNYDGDKAAYYDKTYCEIFGHDLIHHDGQAATCGAAGWAAYDTCSRCDYSTYQEIPATGNHTPVEDPAVPATCTATGLTAGSHCSVCGAVLTAQEVVQATGVHTYVNGVCSVCGAADPAVVAQIVRGGNTLYFTSLAAAVSAAQDGDTITLLTDIQLSGADIVHINKIGTYTIDGDGHSITPASDSAYIYHRFLFGESGQAYDATRNFTLKNVTISVFSNSTYFIRAEGCVLTLDNCVITNNTLSGQADSRLIVATHADVTLRNCTVSSNNSADSLFDFNCNASGNGTNALLVDNCLFNSNTCGGVAIIQVAEDRSAAVKDSSFIGNTVNASNNGAVVYFGATGGDCTGSLFMNNTINYTTTPTYENRVRAAGAIFTWARGDNPGTISGNAFINNSVVKKNANFLTCYAKAIYSGGYYSAQDLAGNYFGGSEPVIAQANTNSSNNDIYAEYSKYAITASTYAISYAQNANNYGVTVTLPTFVAQIGNGAKYESLAEAIAAVPANGTKTTITMLANSAETGVITVAAGKNVELDLNDKTVSYTTTVDDASTYFITNTGTLTIKDSGTNGRILLTAPNVGYSSYETVTVYNLDGTLNLTDGIIENAAPGGLAYAVNNSSNAWGSNVVSTFNMNGGVVSAPHGDAALRVYQNCAAAGTLSKNYVNITAGTILDSGIFVDTTLYTTNSDVAEYTGANIDTKINISGTAVINGLIDMKIRHPFNTVLNITGGDFTNSKLWVRKVASEYGGTPKTGTIAEPTEPMVTISGGTWSFTNNKAFGLSYDCGATSWTSYEHPYLVSGGVFNVNLKNFTGVVFPEGKTGVANTDAETSESYPYTVGVETVYVAQIGETGYETFEAAVAAANADKNATDANPVVVELLTDVNVSAAIMISNHVTLDGRNHTITTTANRGIRIDASGVSVTVKDLTITGSKMERAIQVDSAKENVKLTIDHVTATATMYTVNICGNVDNLTLAITDSTITGWGAVNLWGNNGTVTISGSTLSGINDKGYNPDGWNDFGTIIVEGDTTGQTTEHASAYNISISNTAISATQTTGNQQFVLLYNNPSTSNNMTLTDCTITLGSNCIFWLNQSGDGIDESTTKIKDTYMTGTNNPPELPDGFTYVDVANDYKQIAKSEPQATVSIVDENTVTAEIDAGYFAEDAEAPVTFSPDSAPELKVVFDAEAVQAIAANADDCDVRLKVENVTEFAAVEQGVAVYEITMVKVVNNIETDEVFAEENAEGTATITVPFQKDTNNQNPVVVYLLENGAKVQAVPCTYVNGYVTFTVEHFSTYSVEQQANSVAKISTTGGDRYYTSLADAFADVSDGETIVLLADSTGAGLFIGKNKFTSTGLTIDFNNHTYTVETPVGSPGTVNQALHFEQGNKITLTGGTINVTNDSDKLEAFEMFMQNYCNLTIDSMTIDGTGIAVATYSDSKYQKYPEWYLTEKPQFNYNTAGSSVIRNSTVTMPGALGVDDTAVLLIEKDAVINVSAIATKGTDQRYASATSVVNVENDAKFTLSGNGAAAAFEAYLAAKGQSLGTPVNGVYTVETLKVAQIVRGAETLKFASLAEAVTAAQAGETITLLENVALTAPQNINKSLNIDLNGHNITAADCRALHIQSGEVEITGTGTIKTEGSAFNKDSSVIRVGNSGAAKAKLTLGANVTVSSDHCYGITVFGTNTAGVELVVNGTVAVTGLNGAISGNGNSGNKGAVTINAGATVSSTVDAAIYHPQKDTLTINGGTITGPTAVYVKSGTVEINGGTLTGNGAAAEYSYNGNGLNATGDALVVDNCGYPGGAPTVEISGGTFTSTNGVGIGSYSNAGTGASDPGLAVVNATNTTGITIDPDFKWVENTTTGGYDLVKKVYVAQIGDAKYESLAEAVAAASAGDTVKLLADSSATASITISKNLTIDLNGKTYTTSAGDGFLINSAACVVITDTSDNALGKIVKTGNNYDAIDISGGSRLEFNAGTIESSARYGAVYINDTSTFILNGGRIVVDYDIHEENGQAVTLVGSANATISSGSIESSNYGIAIFHESTLTVNGTASITTNVLPALSSNGSASGENTWANGAHITISGTPIITTENAAAIYAPASEWTISGGTITGDTALYAKGGKVTIKGGTFIGNGTSAAFVHKDNFCEATGDAIVIESCNYPYSPTTVSISGGTFTSTNAQAVATYSSDETQYATATGFITGGRYSSDVEDTYVADGYFDYEDSNVYIVGGPYEARIGDTGYTTLAEAVTAAQAGDTITLLDDIALDATQVINKSLTLNLNGKNITATDARALHIQAGEVAITGEGTITSTHTEGNTSFVSSSSVIRVGNNQAAKAKLTIGEDVTVEAPYSYGVTVFGTNAGGVELVVNGTVTANGAQAAISGNGNSGNKGAVTINEGAVVTATSDAAIYHPQNDTLTINGGTITGPTAVYVKSGTVEINGGTLTGNGAAAEYSYNGNGLNATGDALVVDNCGYPGGAPAVVISGGTFTSTNGDGIGAYYGNNATAIAEVTATGNNIDVDEDFKWVAQDTDPVTYLLTECDYVAQIERNGETLKYESLADAVEAAQANDTITIIANFAIDASKTAETDRIVVDKAVTIDFGEYTMSVPGSLEPTANWAALYIDADVTITGTTGGIDCLDKENGGCGVYALNVRNNATLEITGGYYHGGGTIVQAQLGHVVIEDGMFTVTPFEAPYGSNYALNCVDDAYQNDTAGFAIQGGTFVGFDPQDIAAEGEHTDFTANGYVAIEGPAGTFVVQPGCNVTFDADGGAPEPAAQRVALDGKATEPETAPTKEGFIFGGWLLDDSAFDFSTELHTDIDLVALWTLIVATIDRNGETLGFATLKEAVEAAQNNDTITIVANFTIDASKTAETDRIVVDKAVTIDFGEYTMSVPGSLEPTANWAALYIDADTTITATTGGIDCLDKENDSECGVYAFNVRNNATLTITGGHYHGGGTIVQAQLGHVVIEGGEFTVTPYEAPYGSDFALNCVDAAYGAGTAGFSITGGTFVGFDPQDIAAEGEHTDFTANGYVAIEGPADTFTVVEGGTIVFRNYDGTELQSERLAKNAMPAYNGETPTKPADAQYTYEFAGWKDENDVTHAAELPQVTGDATYTATFTPVAIEYTVKFNANGGTGSMNDQPILAGVATALNPNSFARTNYEFLGWATSANGEVVYADKAEVTLSANLELFAVWQEEEQPSGLVVLNGVLYSYNLTLEDSILINEQILFPNDGDYDVTKFAVKAVFGGNTTTTNLSEDLIIESNHSYGGKTYTVYQVSVADCFAKQMTDEVHITFNYDGKAVADSAGTAPREYIASIRSYCEDVLDHESNYNAKLVTLCRATLSYGAAAQTRFEHNMNDMADSKYGVESPSTTIPSEYAQQAAVGSCSAVRGVSINLVLESKTHINFYIHPADGHTAEELYDLVTVKLGDSEVTNYTKTIVTQGDMSGTLLVTIRGIMAKNLADVYAVSVGNDMYGTRTWYQSALNYAYNAQTQAQNDKAITCALYDYWQAAKVYLNNQ